MHRRILALAVVLFITVLAPAAQAAQPVPPHSHVHGHSYVQWMRMVGQFYLGDASNPLIAGLEQGDCGDLRHGVFFMVAPIDLGVELDCDVPKGTFIVLSHAGYFTTQGIDGDTDAELEAAARAGFVTTRDELSLDGRDLSLPVIDTGAYDVVSEPGSFYDTVLGLGTGPIRSVVRGNLVVLHPLRPGDHVITGAVSFANGEAYSVTYHVHVG